MRNKVTSHYVSEESSVGVAYEFKVQLGCGDSNSSRDVNW